jgi:hypothetical protein
MNTCKKCGKEFNPIVDVIAAEAVKYHYKRTVCFNCVPYKKRKDRVRKNEICRYCNKEYAIYTYFDGKKIWRPNRRACFECVPYLPGKSITQTKNTLDGKRKCTTCERFLSFSEFSPTDEFGGLSSYCKICARKRKLAHSQKFKKECIDYKGGCCIRCGYKKCPAALEFHHRDPTEKEFMVSKLNTAVLTNVIKKELDKCDLVCSNCHKEVHYMAS